MTTTQSEDAVSRAILQAYVRADKPMHAQLDVTYRCELACQHCYLDNRADWPELTTTEWFEVLRQLAELGVCRLTWSGGDPIRRADLLELLQFGARLGFSHVLRTHAMTISPQLAAQLAAANVVKAMVSVYSLRDAIHDRMTTGPGSLAATLRGIDNLLAAGIEVNAAVFVLADAIEEIPEIAAYFAARKVHTRFGTKTHRDHLARTDLDALDLTSEQRIRARQLAAQVDGFGTAQQAPVTAAPEPSCSAGRTALYISPDGAVWPCVMFPMELGHLRKQKLAQIWRDSPQRREILGFDNRHRTTCQSCAGSGTCFFCMGDAFKTTGDFRQAPAHFHSRTRDWMHGYEAAHGPTWTPEQWATVPSGGKRPPRPARFVFPIYRPRKGQGARVATASTEP